VAHRRSGVRAFMLGNQYKVMAVSLAVGFALVLVYDRIVVWWVFSRGLLALTVAAFIPAALVILAHLRETWIGGFCWWDSRDTAWTTRRSKRFEKIELVVVITVWSVIAMVFLTALFAYPHK